MFILLYVHSVDENGDRRKTSGDVTKTVQGYLKGQG